MAKLKNGRGGKGKGSKSDIDKDGLSAVGGGIVFHDGKEEHADIRERVLRSKLSIDKARWDLAEALHQIKDRSLYHHWGYSSWEVYVSEEVGLTVRTAQYLTAMYRWFFVQIGPALSDEIKNQLPEKLREIGWTKARALVDVAQAKDVLEWLEKAKGMSTAELETEAKKSRAQSSGVSSRGIVTMKKFSCTVPDDGSMDRIDEALEMAKERLGVEEPGKGRLLAMISTDFVASNMAQTGKDQRGKYLNRIGAIFGLRLIAVDKESGKVVHGSEILKALETAGQ